MTSFNVAVVISSLLALNRFHTLIWCFYFSLWTSKCWVGNFIKAAQKMVNCQKIFVSNFKENIVIQKQWAQIWQTSYKFKRKFLIPVPLMFYVRLKELPRTQYRNHPINFRNTFWVNVSFLFPENIIVWDCLIFWSAIFAKMGWLQRFTMHSAIKLLYKPISGKITDPKTMGNLPIFHSK